MVWDGTNVQTKQYWNLEVPVKDMPIEDFGDQFLSLFRDSVNIRTRCDVEFGAYLSGGVDSSSVVATLVNQGVSKIKTFCLGYTGTSKELFGKQEDVDNSQEVSNMFGTDHHLLIISPFQFADAMPKIIEAFDEPFSGTVSTYFVSQLIHEHVKVALSGDGADELFGSYLAHRLSIPVQKILKSSPQLIPSGKHWRKQLFVFRDQELRKLLTFMDPKLYASAVVKDFSYDDDPVNQVLFEDQQDLLPNQVLPFVDRLSMAHSVEVRCPYLDYRIIELVNSMPGENLKLSEFLGTKQLQRTALRDRERIVNGEPFYEKSIAFQDRR